MVYMLYWFKKHACIFFNRSTSLLILWNRECPIRSQIFLIFSVFLSCSLIHFGFKRLSLKMIWHFLQLSNYSTLTWLISFFAINPLNLSKANKTNFCILVLKLYTFSYFIVDCFIIIVSCCAFYFLRFSLQDIRIILLQGCRWRIAHRRDVWEKINRQN